MQLDITHKTMFYRPDASIVYILVVLVHDDIDHFHGGVFRA